MPERGVHWSSRERAFVIFNRLEHWVAREETEVAICLTHRTISRTRDLSKLQHAIAIKYISFLALSTSFWHHKALGRNGLDGHLSALGQLGIACHHSGLNLSGKRIVWKQFAELIVFKIKSAVTPTSNFRALHRRVSPRVVLWECAEPGQLASCIRIA